MRTLLPSAHFGLPVAPGFAPQRILDRIENSVGSTTCFVNNDDDLFQGAGATAPKATLFAEKPDFRGLEAELENNSLVKAEANPDSIGAAETEPQRTEEQILEDRKNSKLIRRGIFPSRLRKEQGFQFTAEQQRINHEAGQSDPMFGFLGFAEMFGNGQSVEMTRGDFKVRMTPTTHEYFFKDKTGSWQAIPESLRQIFEIFGGDFMPASRSSRQKFGIEELGPENELKLANEINEDDEVIRVHLQVVNGRLSYSLSFTEGYDIAKITEKFGTTLDYPKTTGTPLDLLVFLIGQGLGNPLQESSQGQGVFSRMAQLFKNLTQTQAVGKADFVLNGQYFEMEVTPTVDRRQIKLTNMSLGGTLEFILKGDKIESLSQDPKIFFGTKAKTQPSEAQMKSFETRDEDFVLGENGEPIFFTADPTNGEVKLKTISGEIVEVDINAMTAEIMNDVLRIPLPPFVPSFDIPFRTLMNIFAKTYGKPEIGNLFEEIMVVKSKTSGKEYIAFQGDISLGLPTLIYDPVARRLLNQTDYRTMTRLGDELFIEDGESYRFSEVRGQFVLGFVGSKAWEKLGIKFKIGVDGANPQYASSNPTMSRDQALEALGLGPSANQTEIKKAYRQLAKRYHPDRNPTRQEWAEEKFKAVQAAYDFLTA